jgi:acyl carrier protein
MSDNVEQRVRSFIIERFLFGQGGEDLKNTDSLLQKGIIDSTGALEVVSFLEEEYGISVEDKELVPDNLDGIGRIAAFVGRKLGK